MDERGGGEGLTGGVFWGGGRGCLSTGSKKKRDGALLLLFWRNLFGGRGGGIPDCAALKLGRLRFNVDRFVSYAVYVSVKSSTGSRGSIVVVVSYAWRMLP